MRNAVIKTLAILVLAGAASAVPAGAAEDPLRGAGLEQEVRELNATLGQLVDLLRRQLESSNAAVLMQRVQLMTARIAPVEEELRAARAEQQSQQDALDDLELSAVSLQADLERQVGEERITAEEARRILEQQGEVLDQRRKQVEDRLWAAQQVVIGLEQRLAKRRTEIETWEGEIDRALGLR